MCEAAIIRVDFQCLGKKPWKKWHKGINLVSYLLFFFACRLFLLCKLFGGFTVSEFSSNLTETQRKGVIRDFKDGKIDLLVSSDAMARGMHIDNVKLVVNYDTAVNGKTYVHRVGRTARAGSEGK